MIKFKEYIKEARARGTIEEVLTRQDFFQKMRELRQHYDKASIYFHQDLDGVTTAIGMRELLKQGGFKVVSSEWTQYGDVEFAVKKPENGVMPVLVDFAHGKPMFKIHTDHHDSQPGSEETEKSGATYFPVAVSNAETISGILSLEDIFSKSDIHIINMVDGARYYENKITPEEVRSFVYEPTGNTKRDKIRLGLVANKLLLTYKNQPGFLSHLVMSSTPSLINIYHKIKEFAKKNPGKYAGGGRYVVGLADPKMLKTHQDKHTEEQRNPDTSSFTYLEDYKLVAQNGAGNTFLQGSYDRFDSAYLFPEAKYVVVRWEMGLVQAAGNAYLEKDETVHLGRIKDEILSDLQPKLSEIKIGLGTIKTVSESKADSKKFPDSVGFKSEDLYALFNLKGVENPHKVGKKEVERYLNSSSRALSRDQINRLNMVTIPLYDIILAKSGGHKGITNVSGFEYIVDEHLRETWERRIQNHFLLRLAKVVTGRNVTQQDIIYALKNGKKQEISTQSSNDEPTQSKNQYHRRGILSGRPRTERGNRYAMKKLRRFEDGGRHPDYP